MDVINKLYTSVSSTVSQLSNALPGNPVTREFEVSEQICSAGVGLLWKVYRGTKKTTKQEAAIFVFEKKQLDRWNKEEAANLIDNLKRGINQITKIRHPQILTIQCPLEESRESLAFATEPVFASLSNILGNTHNMQIPSPVTSYKLHDVEIKYGLIQLSEGLGFLHSDVKLLHRNVSPESIVINYSGAWKIFGFDYCVLNQNPHDAQPFWPFVEYNSSWHQLMQPSLEYMAPECALISKHSAASDIYSLGVLIYTLYSNGGKPIKMFGKDFSAFRRYATELKQGKYPSLTSIPEGLVDQVRLMLNATPEMRPDIHQFTKIPYFEDVGVKTLSYLDSLFQWDNLNKSKFFKGLPQIIQKLPPRINLHRVLPSLVKEFINPPMIPFVLPNVLLIAEGCTNQEYVKHILVHIKPVMKISEPIQILLIFMQKMDLLLKLTPPEDVRSDVLPMLYRALESQVQQIQELCLSILPTFASLVDYPSMKNSVLPRVKKLCLQTGLVSVRVNCLLCIGKLLDHLDKWLVLDEIIPFLPQIPSREPAVLMAVLGIYKLALTHSKLGLTKEALATKVIPFLVPLAIENSLSLSQFNSMMTLIKDIINRIEVEHKSKLEQLTSMQKETTTLKMSLPVGQEQSYQPSNELYSDLGLEQFLNSIDGEFQEAKHSDSGKSIANSSSTFSLQEKQRLTQQQEQNRRLNSQPAIVPKATPLKITSLPKDLTSSLLDSNLKQLKLTHNTSNNNTWFNNNSTSGGGSNWNTQATKVNSNNNDWGAFDSIQTINRTAKIPINQMSNSNSQSLLMHTNSVVGNISNVNKSKSSIVLSSDDIMEFLKSD